MKKHVDEMYNLVNGYAKQNAIKLAYNDIAEKFVESIANYIVESQNETNESNDILQTNGTTEHYKMEYISNYDAL